MLIALLLLLVHLGGESLHSLRLALHALPRTNDDCVYF
jgi:hypothetical protein